MKWKRKKRKSQNQNPNPKALQEYALPILKRLFLVPRKAGYSPHGSARPVTGSLTPWIPTGEFAKTITSIISFPWQPHNTRSVFNESLALRNRAGQEPSPRAPQLPGEPQDTPGHPAAPAIPTALFPPNNWEKPEFAVFNTRALAQSKQHRNTKSLTRTSAKESKREKNSIHFSGAQTVYKITINELILAEVPVVWSWRSHWLLLGTLRDIRWWLFSKHWAAQPT